MQFPIIIAENIITVVIDVSFFRQSLQRETLKKSANYKRADIFAHDCEICNKAKYQAYSKFTLSSY